MVSAVSQIPEKSGCPSAVLGVGAIRFGLPSEVLGTPAVGYFNHCADAVEDQVSSALTAIAKTAERMMEWGIFQVYLRHV
jgi:hypothetical protein